MPRIRTIKPELPEDEKLGRVSRDARLLFILLWTRCDDHGRFRASSLWLKHNLYPYDADLRSAHVEGWLRELERIERVFLYEIGAERYGVVPTWSRHQRVDNAARPLYPEPPHDIPSFAASRGETPLDLDLDLDLELARTRAHARDPAATEGEPSRHQPPPRTKPTTDAPPSFEITGDLQNWAASKSIHVDLATETERWLDYHRAKGTRFRDWTAAWRNWMRRAQDYADQRNGTAIPAIPAARLDSPWPYIER